MHSVYYTDQIQKDPLIVLQKINGCRPKFVERKWKIEETKKNKCQQFKTVWIQAS